MAPHLELAKLVEILPGIEIAADLPAVYIKPANAVVISDTHIGYEDEMASQGVFIPRVQKKRMIEAYTKALNYFKTRKLVVNGDVKHSFSRLTKQEREELSQIFTDLKEKDVDVTIIRGNHDNYLAQLAEKFDVRIEESLVFDNIVLYHGHTEVVPEKGKIYVIGHEHPRISIRDSLGFKRRFKAFLVVPLKEGATALVLPSTGIYQPGNDISLIRSNYLSPLIREHATLEKAKSYLIVEGEGIMEFPELELIKDLI